MKPAYHRKDVKIQVSNNKWINKYNIKNVDFCVQKTIAKAVEYGVCTLLLDYGYAKSGEKFA
jgi:hypothetical protein